MTATEAFWNCGGITALELPRSLRIIGKEAFDYCSALSSVVFAAHPGMLTLLLIRLKCSRVATGAADNAAVLFALALQSAANRRRVATFLGAAEDVTEQVASGAFLLCPNHDGVESDEGGDDGDEESSGDGQYLAQFCTVRQ